ncbi:MAG: hypothetical protein ACFFCI_06100 [Promethearchaeota archaeon]
MNETESTVAPAEGERRAIKGYEPQYHLATCLVINGLHDETFEKIQMVNPEAGRVDDIIIHSSYQIDAYQVKWSENYWNYKTDFIGPQDNAPCILKQLVDGWNRLKVQNKKVVVHLFTNIPPSTHDQLVPNQDDVDVKRNSSYFIQHLWLPAKQDMEDMLNSVSEDWRKLWYDLIGFTELSEDDFKDFINCCELELGQELPDTSEFQNDFALLFQFLFKEVGESQSRTPVEFTRSDIINLLEWQDRFEMRSTQDFLLEKTYIPLESKIEELNQKLKLNPGGYIAILGPPGIGKTSFVANLNLGSNVILVKYYIHLPYSGESVVFRAQATNFFHDIVLRFERLGLITKHKTMDLSLSASIKEFKNCLNQLSHKWDHDGIKTVIVIDGIDHVERLSDLQVIDYLMGYLPQPSALPEGIYFILSSQTITSFPDEFQLQLRGSERKVELENLSSNDVLEIISRSDIPFELSNSQQEKVWHLSNGHPLALIYLLNRISQENSEEVINDLLADYPVYESNIDEVYQSHWNIIGQDREVQAFFGEISRLRKYIPLDWVTRAYEHKKVAILNEFSQYFKIDRYNRAYFFHSSFKEFLKLKTSTLLGVPNEEVEANFHSNLVEKIAATPVEEDHLIKHEILYHLFKANKYEQILNMISQDYFRNQFFQFRHLSEIEFDLELVHETLNLHSNPLKFLEFVLIGAEMKIRKRLFEDFYSQIFDLLLYLGKIKLIIDNCRNGYQLLVPDIVALGVSKNLFLTARAEEDEDLKKQTRLLFKMSSPIQFFTREYHRREDFNKLRAWIRAASHFLTLDEILLRIDQEHNMFDNDEFLDLRSQVVALVHRVVLEDNYWCEDVNQHIPKMKEKLDLSRNLDRIIWIEMKVEEILHMLQNSHDADRTSEEIGELINFLTEYNQIPSATMFRHITEIYRLANKDLQELKPFFDDEFIDQILEIKTFHFSTWSEQPGFFMDILNTMIFAFYFDKLDVSQFQEFPRVINDDRACARYFRDTMISVAHSSFLVFKGNDLNLEHLGELFSLFLTNLERAQVSDPYHFMCYKAPWDDLFKEIVQLSLSIPNGPELLKESLLKEWDSPSHGISWSVNLKRELVIILLKTFREDPPLKEVLSKLETDISETGDQHGRISHLWHLAKIYMELGNRNDVERLLNNILRETFRIGYRKDYQLESLIRSCSLFATHFPQEVWELLQEIIGWIPELAMSTESPAERSAALECLDVITHLYPAESLETFKWFFDAKSIKYFEGLEIVINKALQDNILDLSTVIALLLHYFIPLSDNIPSQLMETTILRIYQELDTPEESLLSIIEAIRTHTLPSIRPKWLEEILIFVLRDGNQIDHLNIQEEEIAQDIYDDNKLVLNDDSKLSIISVYEQVRNIEDYNDLRAQVKRHNLFPWDAIIGYSIRDLSNEEQSQFIRGLESYYLLLRLFEKYNRVGITEQVRKAFLSILESNISIDFPPTGWSNPYFFELMANLASFDPDLVPEKIIPRILKYMGKDRLYFHDKMLVCDSLISILLSQKDINIRLLWEFLRNYIKTLFEGICLPDFTRKTDSSQSVENLIFSHVIKNLEHDSRTIREASIRLIISLLKHERENLMELILAHLSDISLPQYGMLQFLSCYKQEFGELSPSFIMQLNTLYKFPNIQYRFLIDQILREVSDYE